MLWCSQSHWDGEMPFGSPSGPCFSSGLGTAGHQLDTRRWQRLGVCGERMCKACSGHQVIRVSNIRRLMSTGLPLRPRESKGQLQRVTHLTKPASRTESSSGETSLAGGERKDEVVHKTQGQRSSNGCQRFRWLQGMGLLPGGSQGPATHPSIRAGKAQCPLYSTERKKWCFSRMRAI